MVTPDLSGEESPNTISLTELWAVDNVDQYKYMEITSREKFSFMKFRESATETIKAPSGAKCEKLEGVFRILRNCYFSSRLATAEDGKPCPVQGQGSRKGNGRPLELCSNAKSR